MTRTLRTAGPLLFALLALCGCRSQPASPSFTNPLQITHRFLPLSSLNKDTLMGIEDEDTVLVVRSATTRGRSFVVQGKTVQTFAMEDREYVNGELEEVTLDYFAQADDSTVYYFGEDVDNYENGRVVGHSGAWLYGTQTSVLGVIMPGHPAVGTTFSAESVPGITVERDSVVSLTDSVTVPAGTFTACLRVREDIGGGVVEYKYYAPGVGVVREQTPEGNIDLISHR